MCSLQIQRSLAGTLSITEAICGVLELVGANGWCGETYVLPATAPGRFSALGVGAPGWHTHLGGSVSWREAGRGRRRTVEGGGWGFCKSALEGGLGKGSGGTCCWVVRGCGRELALRMW